MKSRILLSIGCIAIVALLFVAVQWHLRQTIPRPLSYVCPVKSGIPTMEVATCRDCMFYPLDRAHSLPASYEPTLVPTGLPGGGRVTPEVKPALAALFFEANERGLFPSVTSAYRSYDQQVQTFFWWVSNEFETTHNPLEALMNASQYSAWAGHSEHQLGTAVDLNCLTCTPFDDKDPRNLRLWKFLEEHAHTFGFVISYPRNGAARTGYIYEPWHIRYVGVLDATELYDQGYTAGNGVCLLSLLQGKHGH